MKEVETLKQDHPVQRIGYFPEPQQDNREIEPNAQPASDRSAHISIPRLLLLASCTCVFVVCSFLLIRYACNIAVSRRAAAHLEQAYEAAQQSIPTENPAAMVDNVPSKQSKTAALPSPVPAAASVEDALWPQIYPDNPTKRVSAVFYQLQRQNPDIVAWIKIEDVLEQPVVQRDNEYYLTRNSLKQKSVTGALFLDENCNLDSVPAQMIIHGHNMKDGSMFGSLMKYKTRGANFYHSHPYIEFNTIYENGRYVIFAVCEVDIRRSKPDYLPFWQYNRFDSAESFQSYVDRARSLSQLRCSVDVQPGDRLLTLSTCITSDDNKRLVVLARKLRPNEDEFQLNISVLSTSDR